MAGFYWYERNPQLFNDEKQAMNLYFPNFVLDRLADGRICWVGNLNPRGADGGTWTLMVVYDHNHPHNNTCPPFVVPVFQHKQSMNPVKL